MSFTFTQTQVNELTLLRITALAEVANDPSVQGAYAPLYKKVFEMISDNIQWRKIA